MYTLTFTRKQKKQEMLIIETKALIYHIVSFINSTCSHFYTENVIYQVVLVHMDVCILRTIPDYAFDDTPVVGKRSCS